MFCLICRCANSYICVRSDVNVLHNAYSKQVQLIFQQAMGLGIARGLSTGAERVNRRFHTFCLVLRSNLVLHSFTGICRDETRKVHDTVEGYVTRKSACYISGIHNLAVGNRSKIFRSTTRRVAKLAVPAYPVIPTGFRVKVCRSKRIYTIASNALFNSE
jgi:hypothetical protein